MLKNTFFIALTLITSSLHAMPVPPSGPPELVTYNFSGVVDSSLQPLINIGDTFSFNYTWDAATTAPANSYEALTSLTGSIGGYQISGAEDLTSLPPTAGTINIVDGFQDSIVFLTALNALPNVTFANNINIGTFFMALNDFSGTAFNGTSLINSLALSDFDSTIVHMDFLDGSQFQGSITSITEVTAVPVPASIWLLMSGTLGLLALARRRKEVS